ncbi:D-threo-aldose 1-dehydrogenase [Friedmanniella luteola]|uniref:D-threo-aldose 1-dehydrogenase n=1 Tax=Friedmanniella luteola TaxID=546871 RepID=A0A1H1XUR0_9ACTN|nr:aldo/keto reductase [Friedmanniella luteola]SDT12935.1 D-threo-aldose 1-dehydrogenase [Friedmanniella luteola]
MVDHQGRERLGRTGVRVTPLGFGAAALGNLYAPVTDEDARAAVDAAWGAGIRYFDTAPHYGLGLSERRLGAALAGRPRDQFVVSTKVGRLLVPNPHPTGSDREHQFAVPDTLARVRDYSADGVRRSLEASLERLGLDRADVVLVHDPDDALDQALGEAVPALAALRDQGVIGAVGVGMNQWQALRRFVLESAVDVVMVAGRWTLVDRSAEPLMTAAAERGVSVLAAAAYNSGLLASARPADDATFDYGPAPAEVLADARRWADRAEQHGVALPDLALQFPLRHPATAAVVVGLRSAAEVAAAVERMNRPIAEAVWAEG